MLKKQQTLTILMSLETYLRDYLQNYKPRGNDYSNLLHKPLFLVYLLGGEIRKDESGGINRVKVFGLPEVKIEELEKSALYLGFEHALADPKLGNDRDFAPIRYDMAMGYATARAFINMLKLSEEKAEIPHRLTTTEF